MELNQQQPLLHPPHELSEIQQQPPSDPIDLVGGPFAVIESDPGVFTSLTRRLGIPGLELVELYDIEPWAVDHLNPHGLIFCFMWKKDAHRPADFDDPAAERVWFANQLSDDACATHAILNVVLNCPGIELGEELSAFRRETEAMSPVMRGLAVTNSRVIRPAHNSLARPSDIRASVNNLAITTFDAEKRKEKELKAKAKQDAPSKRVKTGTGTSTTKITKAKGKSKGKEKATSKAKPKATAKAKAKRKGKTRYDDDEDEDEDQESTTDDEDEEEDNEEETYHFIGYVPAHGKVWELDGLKSGPLEVGELPSPAPAPTTPSNQTSSSSNQPPTNPPAPANTNPNRGWMDIARPALRMKMDKYGGSASDGSNIRFSLLAIVDDAFRTAHDGLEFWRRERAVLERSMRARSQAGDGGAGAGAGWEAMVDPSLLASANSAFTPPIYPLSPLPPPQSSSSSNTQTSSNPNLHPHPHPHCLKPFAKDFASRRMQRDMQIMSMSLPTPVSTSTQQQQQHHLPNQDQDQDSIPVLAREWETCVREGVRAKVLLEDEVMKGIRANTDHIKRTFDYEPFVREYLSRLRQEALLNPLLDRDEEGRKVRKTKTKAKEGAKEKG